MSSFTPQLLGIAAAGLTAVFVFDLLRRGLLPERFAALWLSVAGVLLVLAAFPQLLNRLASILGVAVPSNLLFFGAGILLLIVSVQLSYEVSKLDNRTRRLAEDLAILTETVREMREADSNEGSSPPNSDARGN